MAIPVSAEKNDDDNKVHLFVENLPQYPGGISAMGDKPLWLKTDNTSAPVLNTLTQLTECCPFFNLLNTQCLGTTIADIMV